MVGQFFGHIWSVVWVSSRSEGPRFPFLLTFSSNSLYFGIEFEEDLKPILGLFYLFLIFDKFENSFAVCVEKGYSGFAVCVEKGYFGFVKGSFLGLRMKICWVCEKGIFWITN